MKKPGCTILSEPLVVFLVVGMMLFAIDHLFTGHNTKPEIIVSSTARLAILDQEQRLKGRDLTVKEQDLAINNFIDDEILLKEAYRLGLDRDQIIRTRLLRKMRRIITVEQPEPTEEELNRFYSNHLDRYEKPSTTSFEQIYFSLENPAQEQVLKQLNEGKDPQQMGDSHSRFPTLMQEQTDEAIAARFGENVSSVLRKADKGIWYGPIISPFGEHFVRVQSIQKGRFATYPQVKAYVKRAWLKSKETNANATYIATLRNQYSIRVDVEE